jgi:hypothetical protein
MKILARRIAFAVAVATLVAAELVLGGSSAAARTGERLELSPDHGPATASFKATHFTDLFSTADCEQEPSRFYWDWDEDGWPGTLVGQSQGNSCVEDCAIPTCVTTVTITPPAGRRSPGRHRIMATRWMGHWPTNYYTIDAAPSGSTSSATASQSNPAGTRPSSSKTPASIGVPKVAASQGAAPPLASLPDDPTTPSKPAARDEPDPLVAQGVGNDDPPSSLPIGALGTLLVVAIALAGLKKSLRRT